MVYYYLICRSLTYAQRTARTLERIGITATVTKIPQQITTNGCGYCVKISGRNVQRALDILRDNSMYPARIFVQYADGSLVEVWL